MKKYSFCRVALTPDIVLGLESWLDGNSVTAEILPANLQVIIKDHRNAKEVETAMDQINPVFESLRGPIDLRETVN